MQRRLTSTRTGVLAVGLLVIMAVFVVRLFYLQIIKHSEYVTLARQSQQRSFVLPAARGKLYMMDGQTPVPVVLNQSVYTMIADPQTVPAEQRPAIVAALKQLAGGEMASDAAERLARTGSRYEVLARRLTRGQAEKLKVKNFAGVLYQPGSVRYYPEGQLAAQVLGFVNAEGKGQYGVEQQLHTRLKGRDGLLQSVTDVRNVPLTVGKQNIRIEPKPGEHIALTIDRNIQHYTEEALRRGIEAAQATQGNALVMDPRTGQVLAMANYPTFHPAEYTAVKDASVFVNGVTMRPYEPASVIKTFSMATGVDQRVITPQTTFVNTDCVQVADRRMCNAVRGLSGSLTMQQAFNNSLNVGTVTIGRRLGDGQSINRRARQTIYEYYHKRFGFGEPTGIELAEAKGVILSPQDPQGNEVRYANMTFGQGMNLTTIQVAAAFCSVINGGQYLRPTVVAGTVTPQGLLKPEQQGPLRRTVSEETSAVMRQMLQAARHVLAASRTDRPGYSIGGKTGTAEVVIDGSYTADETVATYVGFGGTTTPEYVIMVQVAAPGKRRSLEGSLHAAPIFTDISNWMIGYKKLAPKE